MLINFQKKKKKLSRQVGYSSATRHYTTRAIYIPEKLLCTLNESLKLKLVVFGRSNGNKSIKNLTRSPLDDVIIFEYNDKKKKQKQF